MSQSLTNGDHMRVLIWQSYGRIRVMAAETPMHFFKIYERLKSEMRGWGEDEMLSIVFENMGKALNQKACEKLFQYAIAPHIGHHETFELFEFTTVED